LEGRVLIASFQRSKDVSDLVAYKLGEPFGHVRPLDITEVCPPLDAIERTGHSLGDE
jgi:hypothetical protein